MARGMVKVRLGVVLIVLVGIAVGCGNDNPTSYCDGPNRVYSKPYAVAVSPNDPSCQP